MPDGLSIISLRSRTAAQAVLLIEATLHVDKPSRRLNAAQSAALLAAHPTLAEHACRQQGLGRFGERIAEASLPHLAEHLAIDRLVAEHGQPVAGHTTSAPVRREAGDAGEAMLVRLRLPEGLPAAAAEAALQAAVAELNALSSAG